MNNLSLVKFSLTLTIGLQIVQASAMKSGWRGFVLSLHLGWFQCSGVKPSICPRDLAKTTESRPLCITDLFQNKSVAYFKFTIFFSKYQKKKLYFMQLFNADAKIFLEKLKKNLCQQKVEKNTSKSCILMAVGSFFFSAALPGQNSLELLFCFKNSSIYSCLLKSVV